MPKTYMFVSNSSKGEIRCDVKQHPLKNEEVLNVCNFPPSNVFVYVETQIRVIDTDANSTVYNRNVSVEDQRKCLHEHALATVLKSK